MNRRSELAKELVELSQPLKEAAKVFETARQIANGEIGSEIFASAEEVIRGIKEQVKNGPTD